MDPSSPAKRRALAPLDANVNAMSPTKLHKHSRVPGSPLKSPVKTPLGLKRPLAAVVFDENAVAKKKQCQEPAITVAAPASVSANPPTPTASTPVPAVVSKGTIASTSTSTSAPSPAASAQTEIDTEPDAQEGQSEQRQQQREEQKLVGEQQEQRQPEKMQVTGEQYQQRQTLRNRSASPDTSSSVFDNSAMDTSQENTTMLTEPDAEQTVRALPPPTSRRLLTREEARQKARILKLKLGLANYKLRTGQENVPLDRLEVKPRPGQQQEMTRDRALPRVMVQPPSSRDGPPGKDTEETMNTEHREREPEPLAGADKAAEQTESGGTVLPRLMTTGTRAAEQGEGEPTSAVSGGIATSLLSLARGSSSSSS